jgi:carboxylesterase
VVFAATALVAALAIGVRATYPRLLEARERRRLAIGPDGMVPGAGTIDLPRRGAPAVLVLHGAGDTTQVVADLAADLHRRGFSVRAPLLSGHGRTLEAFARTSAARWHRDAEREFNSLRAVHDWVGVVGLSMGGALALKLASERDDLPALVLLAPYIDMPVALRMLASASAIWGWTLPYFPSLGSRSIHDPVAAAHTRARGLFTPAALRALHDVVRDARSALPLVTAPTLVIQSREDNRISPESAEAAFSRLGSSEKKLAWIGGAGHVITVDFGHERVFELTAAWLETHRHGSRRSGRAALPLT